MKKIYVKIRQQVSEKLRGLCDRLSPKNRLIAVIVLVVLFALVNFHMIFRAIHDIGREDTSRGVMRITPIEVPEFVPGDSLSAEKIQEMEEFFNQFNADSYE